MKKYFLIAVFTSISLFSNAQIIGEYTQETIASFGFCIMPDNTRFLSIEADYDGIYITERELLDLFETGRFEYSKELLDWTYYSYWALNKRNFAQPTKFTSYKMTVDPTGNYLALAPTKGKGWAPTVELFDLSSNSKLEVINLTKTNEDIDYLNLVRFDTTGNQLLFGANDQGIYRYSLKTQKTDELYKPFTYFLADFDYSLNSPILRAYTKMGEDEYILEKQLFVIENTTRKEIKLPLPLHYTRVYTPTQMHKYYGLYYEQAYNTYLGKIDEFNYRLLYHNPKTFVFVTREVPIEE